MRISIRLLRGFPKTVASLEKMINTTSGGAAFRAGVVATAAGTAFHHVTHKRGIAGILHTWGKIGADALMLNTPIDSGLAATSWSYEVWQRGSVWGITWINRDVENGFPVAIMLQYGYATGSGGWVEGRDYINSTLEPIFDQIAYEVWKAVTSA